MDWISTDLNMPNYGDAVLIVINGFTQDITYMRDGDDHCSDWFEPYFFDHDQGCKISWDKVYHWMPLPEPPK